MQIRYDNFMVKLLVSPHWRFFRHLLLCVFCISVAAGLIWHMQEEGQTINPMEKYGGLFLFTFFFIGGSYLNIYVLTPFLLLKNKWGKYFGSLLGLVTIILGSIILIQMTCSNDKVIQDEINYFTATVNLLSSTSSIFLLFVGITTLVLFKNWILDLQQSEELESSTLELELKLLENQINPHFLFNMLNNANIMIKKDTDVASYIIGKLEEMLQYQINYRSLEKVHLKEEIFFLTDFLALEKTRRDYFSYTISKGEDLDCIKLPPLLFISFVENAVKHSQDSQKASFVHISFEKSKTKLIFTCENSLPSKVINNQQGGLGLTNIKRRLDLLYKGNYLLEYRKTDIKYNVKLELKL